MRIHTELHPVFEVVLMLSMALFVVLFIFMVLVQSASIERLLFSQLSDSSSRISLDDRLIIGQHIRNFLKSGSPLPGSRFTAREIMHMRDVKKLFDLEKVIVVISLVIIIMSYLAARPTHVRFRRLLKNTSKTLCFSIIGASLLVALLFDRLFLWFHQVSFSNDLWLLDPRIHILIQVYPQEFFLKFFMFYLLFLFLISCGTWLVLGRLTRH